MTVIGLTVDSYKRLSAAHITPSPTGLIPVRGMNAAGKSSLIESMLAALLGKKGKSELPIMEGAHGAQVVVDLGEIVVTRRWTRDSGGRAQTKLTIEDADGHPMTSPQAILDKLVGQFADPVAFLGLPAAEQVKTVLAVLGLDQELDKLEARAAGYYDQRRDLGRDVTRTEKALDQISAEVEGLPAPPTEGTIEELTAKLQAANESNAGREALKAGMLGASNRGKEAAARLERLEAEVQTLKDEVNAQRATWTENNLALAHTGPPIDPVPIAEALQAHEAASEHAGKRSLLESTRTQHSAAQAAHEEAERGLAAAREEIAELLGSAKFPIDGMKYDSDAKALTISGIPFSSASQAERLKAAAAIAMAGDPAIRVMFVREGSLLDDESVALLAQITEDWQGQLWLERVDSNAAGAGIWIEDGQAYQNEQEGGA